MKFRIIYTFFILFAGAMLFISSKDGRAFDKGQGNTGAPGDEVWNGSLRTCQTCHNSATLQVGMDLEVTDANSDMVTEYIPGETYSVKVRVNPVVGTPAKYGFQIVALKAPLNVGAANIPTWTNEGSNVRIATALNGRQYAEHKGPSDSNEFLVDWVAPEANTGTITFYVCSTGVNNDDDNDGDGASCMQMEMTEGIAAATKDEVTSPVLLNVFPNPIRSTANLSLEIQQAGTAQWRIIDTFGKVVERGKLFHPGGKQTVAFEVDGLAKGMYYLEVNLNGQSTTRKIVKM